MSEFKHAIVVGASSGIGAELVRQLARSGARVAAVARRQERLDALQTDLGGQVLTFAHDVTCFDEVPALFQEICLGLGGLDLIIYCAGVMPTVGAEEYNFEKDRQMIEVNVLGAVRWLNLAAERFENTGHGSIVGIGSVAGDRGRSGQPVYNTSKAALATYLEALRNRVAKKGVTVVTIKPGPTATEMTSHLHASKMDPSQVASVILSKADKTGEHYVKFTHRVAFGIIRRIPSPIFRRLSI
jgi:decaprenylphospho-beta-D-erythro-pentofuranosid-2-ulose 2-reductase